MKLVRMMKFREDDSDEIGGNDEAVEKDENDFAQTNYFFPIIFTPNLCTQTSC